MTGFGRGEVELHGHRFRAEAKSVNHRYFNANLRLPREFSHLESPLIGRCSDRIERGHLNVQLEVEPVAGEGARGPRLRRAVLDRYLELVEGLEGLPGVTGRMPVDALLTLPGVVEWEPEEIELGDDAFLEGAAAAIDVALDELVAAREAEGRALEVDLRARLATIEELRAGIEASAPAREERERERLRRKVESLLSDVDEALEERLAQEVVLLADRVDVSEELTRMAAHLERFSTDVEESDGAIGRKLTFLLQELQREANTIGAKANDAGIQQAAVEIKAELEKMREQAENVE